MKLTSQTNYAVRMLMFCHSKDERATVKEIAGFYGLPERFLFNILLKLMAIVSLVFAPLLKTIYESLFSG